MNVICHLFLSHAKHHKPEHPSLNLLSFFSTPNPWQNRGNRRPSFFFHLARECSVPNKPYSRGCFVLLLLNSISQCLEHLAHVLMVSLMNRQQETLVKTKKKENLLKPARKKKEVICALCLPSLKEARDDCWLPAEGLCFMLTDACHHWDSLC